VDVPSPVAVVARWLAAVLATGFLVLGLAVPLAYAILTVALVEQRAGAPLPVIHRRVGPVVAAASALRHGSAARGRAGGAGECLVLPAGLVAAVLLLFVPTVVLFERAAGKVALVRSMPWSGRKSCRVVVVALAVAGLSAAAFILADLVMPEGGRRSMVFLRVFLGDLLMIVGLPVPALAVARLYLDLRGREGVDAAELAKAARR